MSPSTNPKGISTGAAVGIAAVVTALLTAVGYYWRKEILINEIMHKYSGQPSFDAPREAFYRYNIWELQSILDNGLPH